MQKLINYNAIAQKWSFCAINNNWHLAETAGHSQNKALNKPGVQGGGRVRKIKMVAAVMQLTRPFLMGTLPNLSSHVFYDNVLMLLVWGGRQKMFSHTIINISRGEGVVQICEAECYTNSLDFLSSQKLWEEEQTNAFAIHLCFLRDRLWCCNSIYLLFPSSESWFRGKVGTLSKQKEVGFPRANMASG